MGRKNVAGGNDRVALQVGVVLGRRGKPATQPGSATPAGRDCLAVLASACPAPRRCPGLPGRGGPLTADAVVGEG